MGENLHMSVKQKNKNKGRIVMKNLIGLLAFLAVTAVPAASALEIEIRPLNLEVKAEVFGFQAGVDGKKLIVLTGEAAKKVANAAGQAYDASKEVVILAGEEVEQLWAATVEVVGQTDDVVIVGASWLRDRAIDMALNAQRLGNVTWNFAGTLGNELLKGLNFATDHTVVYVGDFGVAVYNSIRDITFAVGKFICGLVFICR
jgi:hypothetical protein